MHLVSDESCAGQMMMVEASTSSIHTLMKSICGNVHAHSLCRVLVEGGGLMFVFWDENPELHVRPDSSSSRHVREFLLEGFDQKLCIFSLFLSLVIRLVVA